MAELVVGDRTLALDEDGFLEDASLWDEEVAEKLAETEDVVLTDEHWEVINYLRGYYAEFGVAPMVRKMLRDTGKSNAEIYELFPSGPGKGACKIAGLLKPTGTRPSPLSIRQAKNTAASAGTSTLWERRSLGTSRSRMPPMASTAASHMTGTSWECPSKPKNRYSMGALCPGMLL